MPTTAGVHALVRRTHEQRVLAVLRQGGPLSRAEIAARVGLSRTTLSEITSSLIARRAVVVVDTDGDRRTGSGRPAELLALDPASGQFMGVDFGHVRVNVAVADASHEVIAAGTAPYTAEHSWAERTQLAFDLIERLAAEQGVHYDSLEGIGIGVPGPYSTGPAADGAGASGWGRSDISEVVEAAFVQRFGARVLVDNNTRFAALAEAIADDADAPRDLVYVRLSDGVGGGLVVDGRLVTGATGVAGELGHVPVVPSGAPCRCGKRGCLETVAAVPPVLAACRAGGAAVTTLAELTAALEAGDPVVEEVVRDAGAALGRVLAAVVMTVNPAQVVIGGPLLRAAPGLLRQVADTITGEASTVAGAAPEVRAAALGDDDGVQGAIAALFHQSPLLVGYPTARAPEPTAARPDLRRSVR